MSKLNLNQLIEYSSESHTLDFKKIFYDLSNKYSKSEFLKDVVAFVNNLDDTDKMILIGIEEKDGVADTILGIDSIVDQAVLQQILDANIEPSINIEAFVQVYKSLKIGVIRLSGNVNRPYLFKKNFKLKESERAKYRIGDGYIRVGTSTRKMVRKDFDNIYKAKNTSKDRSSDVVISHYLSEFEDESRLNNYVCLDFKIENLSNKSIGLNPEIILYRDDESRIYLKNDLLQSFVIPTGISHISFTTIHTPVLPNFDLYSKKDDSQIYLEVVKRINENDAVTLKQKDKQNSLFFQEIAISKNTQIVRYKLILRGDDFKEGPIEIIDEIKCR